MAETKPELNFSLDDIISKENAAKKAANKKKKKVKQGPPNVDYANFTDDQIKQQLQSRNLSTKGGRPKLVKRLKAEVTRAWHLFNKGKKQNLNNLMPPMQKKPKKKLSEEERNRIHAENEANRLAKAKRRAENLKKQEEDKRRKRQKREENAAKQAELKQQQKNGKEARQRCEVYVQFDLDEYKQVLRKRLDPSGKKIATFSQDFSKKGFVVKFNNEKDATACSRGSTMKKQKKIKAPLMASILPSPVESKCVFFQYPLDAGHPSFTAANSWTLTQNSDEKLPELKKLDIWIKSAATKFSRYGIITNIYRERGFLVINFANEASAKKCFSECEKGKFNGVPLHFVRVGTPTKADSQECRAACKPEKEVKKE